MTEFEHIYFDSDTAEPGSGEGALVSYHAKNGPLFGPSSSMWLVPGTEFPNHDA